MKASRVALLALVIFSATTAFADDSPRGTLASALMSDETAKSTGLDIRGWISQGFSYNPDSPVAGFNGPVSFNDQSNEYQLNQTYLIAERKIEKSGSDFDLGGRVDVLYGTDAAYTQSVGFDDDLTSDGASKRLKLALPQVYLEANLPVGTGLSIKAGHFYTLIGYEVVTAPDNFFYSHAYSMQYAEPFTHWGALASYQITDSVGAVLGLVRGWDNLTDDADGNLSPLGAITWTPNDVDTVIFSLISGNEGQSANRTMYSVVATHHFDDSTSWVIQHDLGVQEHGAADGSNATWYSINNYVIHDYNDTISSAVRFEWFHDDDGTRVAGLRSGSAAAPGDYYEVAIGAHVKCPEISNLIVRPEIRYDVQNRSSGDVATAFDGGRESSQVLLAVDAVLTF